MPRPSGGFQERIHHCTSAPFQNLLTIKTVEHQEVILPFRGHVRHWLRYAGENAALFLPLALRPTLIRHENGSFFKRSSNRRN